MADVDRWLADASRNLSIQAGADLLDGVEGRIAAEPTPRAIAARRDARKSMIGAAWAAVIGFTVAGTAGTVAFARPTPTWVAAPPASSPYSLLIGR
jgi:hypothetical protein